MYILYTFIYTSIRKLSLPFATLNCQWKYNAATLINATLENSLFASLYICMLLKFSIGLPSNTQARTSIGWWAHERRRNKLNGWLSGSLAKAVALLLYTALFMYMYVYICECGCLCCAQSLLCSYNVCMYVLSRSAIVRQH